MEHLFKGKYPRRAKDFIELEQLVEKYVLPGLLPEQPIFSRTDLIIAQGSCFAENIAIALQKRNMNTKLFAFAEAINSPKANEYFYRYACDSSLPFEHKVHEHLFAATRKINISEKIRFAKTFILTLGVASYVILKDTKRPVFDSESNSLLENEIYYPSVDETKESITAIIKSLHFINPYLKIILTVSPVPLNRSDNQSTIVADCISKSTLRAATAELMRSTIPNVYYWPSFEIVRWIGAHLHEPAYGLDDDNARHVNNNLIELIVHLFLKHYSAV